MRRRFLALLTGLLFGPSVFATEPATPPASARGVTPLAVASILPLHSLLAGVMAGVAEPVLLVPAGQSPHKLDLRPSQARDLAHADLFVWIGEALETGLAKSVDTLLTPPHVLTLGTDADVETLPARSGGVWEGHHHDADESHADGEHGIDPHLWLAPPQAAEIVDAMTARLVALDPAHADRYQANAQALRAHLAGLDADLQQTLSEVRGRPYLVFHDAYQYFEARYDLDAVGAVTIDADHAPGARRIAELRRRLHDSGAVCVFTEPQFEPRAVQPLIDGSAARVGQLDPIGQDLTPGPDAYFQLMHRLAADLVRCLQP